MFHIGYKKEYLFSINYYGKIFYQPCNINILIDGNEWKIVNIPWKYFIEFWNSSYEYNYIQWGSILYDPQLKKIFINQPCQQIFINTHQPIYYVNIIKFLIYLLQYGSSKSLTLRWLMVYILIIFIFKDIFIIFFSLKNYSWLL